MTSTPHDPLTGPDVVDLGGEPTPSGSTGRGRKKGLVIGGGLLAVALVGGGAAYAVAALSGGGAQPEASIPSSAFAMVKVDLDPSAGQKIDALRFARGFPDVRDRIGSTDDPRQAIFETLTKGQGLAGNWQTDVEPWLGQRAALAVVPGATPEADPALIVVLAVTDTGKAEAGLAKVTKGKASCTLTGDFAVCAQDNAVAGRAAADAERSALADDATFTKDVDALNGDGVALAWADLAKAKSAVPALASALRSSGAGPLGGSLVGGDLAGRYVAALRFDGPNLEVIGRLDGAPLPAAGGTSGVGDLPAGTVAALGIGGADQLVDTAWKQLRATMDTQGAGDSVDQQVAAVREQYGITIPDDIRAAVGKRVVLAFGGVGQGTPDVALRLAGSPDGVAKLAKVVDQNAGGRLTLGQATAGSDTVLALTQAYADKVAGGSGLGSSTLFTNAVPDAKDAQQVVFVDIPALLAVADDAVGGAAARKLGSLSALGVSAGRDGSAATFRVRLTTR